MLRFKTRALARSFASRTGRKVKDLGSAVRGSRWCVKVIE